MTGLVVAARALDRLARSCELPASLCQVPPEHVDSAVVRLETFRGDFLGIAVVDRATESLRVMSRSHEPDGALESAWAERRLRAALALRADHGLTGPDRAYRLLNGAGDGTPGILADIYGGSCVVSALSTALVPVARLIAETCVACDFARGAVLKQRRRGLPAAAPSDLEYIGAPPPERVIVREGTWLFEVHLATGVNVGLFTDMRDERVRIARLAAGRRVLNLFAYTGAFSVAAASGGASLVTSVDLSEGVLAWARDHFTLNGLDHVSHETVARDAAAAVTEADARGDRYDLILVDPPSYSAARGAPFAIGRDYPALLAGACRLLSPGGYLWAAANTRGFSLTGALQGIATLPGRTARLVATGGLPADHPTEPSDVEARYLQTCLLRLL